MVKKSYILVCGGSACEASKADAIYESFKKILEDEGLKNDVQVVKTGCFGFCEKGPIVKILPRGDCTRDNHQGTSGSKTSVQG